MSNLKNMLTRIIKIFLCWLCKRYVENVGLLYVDLFTLLQQIYVLTYSNCGDCYFKNFKKTFDFQKIILNFLRMFNIVQSKHNIL